MQELWSNDPQIISKEIIRIVNQHIPINLLQKGLSPQALTPVEILNQETGPILRFNKQTTYPISTDPCLFLYQHPKQPMRNFHAAAVLETGYELGILFPTSIFTVQRRKHPRYDTNSNSVTTFTRQASQYLNRGSIQNISIEGAKLVGKFSQHIQKGDLLSPLSMTLRLRHGDLEENITAPEAMVCRVIELNQETRELGIKFILKSADQENLERYLSLCALINR